MLYFVPVAQVHFMIKVGETTLVLLLHQLGHQLSPHEMAC